MKLSSSPRRGFTLTEMLVASALILAIMALIATVFSKSMDTFSKLHSVGIMQDRIRAGSQNLRRDLGAEHFDGPHEAGSGGPYLSDQRLDRPGWAPPKGYVHIRAGAASTPEGFDGDGLPSTYATSHMLAMTVKLPGAHSTELFAAKAPASVANTATYLNSFPNATIYYSRWAEVYYYLRPNGDMIAGTTPLYMLCRRQRLLAPRTVANIVTTNLAADYPDLSLTPTGAANTFRFNTPEDVSNPANRLQLSNVSNTWGPPALGVTPSGENLTGDEIIMPDVISFEVKLIWLNNSSFSTISPAIPLPPGNLEYPFAEVPPCPHAAWNSQGFMNNCRVFDTWYRSGSDPGNGLVENANTAAKVVDWNNTTTTNANSFLNNTYFNKPPLRINVRAVQIKLRIYDIKAKQTRQVTIIQEL